MEISFPTVDNDEVANDQGKKERIERLLQSIILEQNKLDVNDTLPNVKLDKTSLNIAQEFACGNGQVVVENECGKLKKPFNFKFAAILQTISLF